MLFLPSIFDLIVGPYQYLHYAPAPASGTVAHVSRSNYTSGIEVDFNPTYAIPILWIGVEGLNGTLDYRVTGDNGPYWSAWALTKDGTIVSLQEDSGALKGNQQVIDDYEIIFITAYRYPGLSRILFKVTVT